MTSTTLITDLEIKPTARDYAKVTLEAWIRLATYFIEDLGLHGEEVELVLSEAGDQDAADKAKEWRMKHASNES